MHFDLETAVNIHEAKTHLSRLVEQAAAGEEIIIAKAGKPMAKLVPLVAGPREPRPLGLRAGQREVPEDIDTLFSVEIEAMFYGAAPAGMQEKPR
ncbi:MAG: type II toxin-antitoxin system Phd/YefM family antitoxin [Rhodocyclaceae bacterium]|nr:type II toxin-antitoxin system Phd/YefM family antitoxin [Rhodocyclaceae bacterium]